MRRFLALARTAALESLAEPLSAVLFLSALATVHLVPTFHYHQFGEAGRLARECGFSALLVFGLAFATPAAVRAVGRELAEGTAAMALARAVPRALFLCAKIAGVAAAFLLFAAAVLFATALSARTSVLGTAIFEAGGETNVWGPGLAAGLGGTLAAFACAALLNRFASVRFSLWACLLTAAAQPVAALACGACAHPLVDFLPALTALAAGTLVFLAMAGALAVRLGPAATAAFVALGVAASFFFPVRGVVPDVNAFWLVDALANGGAVGWGDVARALGAAAVLIAFWLTAGSALMARREIA